VKNLVPSRFIFLFIFVRFHLVDIPILPAKTGLLRFVEFHLVFNSQQENIYRHYLPPEGSHVLKVLTQCLIILRFKLQSRVKKKVADSFLLLCMSLYRQMLLMFGTSSILRLIMVTGKTLFILYLMKYCTFEFCGLH